MIDDLEFLRAAVKALGSMTPKEQRHSLAYLNERFGSAEPEVEVDQVADVIIEAHQRGIGISAGAVRLAQFLVDAGYRKAAALPEIA